MRHKWKVQQISLLLRVTDEEPLEIQANILLLEVLKNHGDKHENVLHSFKLFGYTPSLCVNMRDCLSLEHPYFIALYHKHVHYQTLSAHHGSCIHLVTCTLRIGMAMAAAV